jgi:hypothetical protein
VALNRVGERGGWEAEVLNAALDGLWGTALADATGWTPDELDDLVASTGGLVADAQDTDAAHAEHGGRGDPAPPREVQDLLVLDQVLKAGVGTLIDADVVKAAIAGQAERIQLAREEAAGTQRLPLDDEPEPERPEGMTDEEWEASGTAPAEPPAGTTPITKGRGRRGAKAAE